MFINKSDKDLDCDLRDLLSYVSCDKSILIYFEGGQDRSFFHDLRVMEGVEILWVKSLLTGFMRIFSFIPSLRGLIRVTGCGDYAGLKKIIDLNAGSSMMSVFIVKSALDNNLSDAIMINQWQERLAALGCLCLRFDFQEGGAVVWKNY